MVTPKGKPDDAGAAKRTRKARQAQAPKAHEATAGQVRVVEWALAQGSPVVLLDGWDPDAGTWRPTSPIGMMLSQLALGAHLQTAARIAGLWPQIRRTVSRGRELAADVVEDRAYIPVEILPLIDLARQIDIAESVNELSLVKTAYNGAKNDPELALKFLARRYPSRWREQQAVMQIEADEDERDAAVTRAISDPNTAMKLASIAHAIEDQTSHT